jgi:hypothetical protein
MRRPPLILLLALASCTRPVAPPGNDLAQAIAGRVPGPAKSCVSSQSGSSLHAIDSATLGYGSGSTIYVNRLGGSCPGLHDLSTIIIEAHGSEYCRGDHFRANEPGSIIPGASCNLGDWVPYRRP